MVGNMTTPTNKDRTLTVTSLLYVITLCALYSYSWADEGANEMPQQPATITLQITDGRVSGYIKDGSIREVLEVISSQHPFEYQANELLFNQRISGQFDEVPLLVALRQILKSFNYYLILSKESGHIESLTLNSIIVTVDHHPGAPAGPSQVDVSGNTFTELLAEMETGEEEHPLFIIEDKQTGPPQELLDSFYPVQEPGSENTGPQAITGEAFKELPVVDAVENDIGPVDPNITFEEIRDQFDSFP